MNISPSTIYTSIAHEVRLRCLLLLLEHDELCVCELIHAIGAAQPTISRHLAHLRRAEVVKDRREGLWIHYRINPELPSWATRVLQETAKGVTGMSPYADDLTALRKMPNRPGASKCA